MSENEKPSEMSLLSKNDTNRAKLAAAANRLRQTIENSKSGDCSWLSRVYDWPFGRDERKPDYRADKDAIIDAYLAEHPADDEEPLSFAWIEDEYRHLLRTYGAVGVALILLRKEGELRWELAVWPMLGGKSDCDLRIVFGDRNVQYEFGLPSLKTRGDLRRLLETLLGTVKTK